MFGNRRGGAVAAAAVAVGVTPLCIVRLITSAVQALATPYNIPYQQLP